MNRRRARLSRRFIHRANFYYCHVYRKLRGRNDFNIWPHPIREKSLPLSLSLPLSTSRDLHLRLIIHCRNNSVSACIEFKFDVQTFKRFVGVTCEWHADLTEPAPKIKKSPHFLATSACCSLRDRDSDARQEWFICGMANGALLGAHDLNTRNASLSSGVTDRVSRGQRGSFTMSCWNYRHAVTEHSADGAAEATTCIRQRWL